MKKLVVVIVANVKRFRLPFYRQLAAVLASQDIDLKVLFSEPDAIEKLKLDSADLPEPLGLKIKGIYFLGNRALLQMPPIGLLASADLVIVVQANGYLLNYFLLPLTWLRLKRVAFWGHAFNHQGNAGSIKERFKRLLATKVHWWFTYTEETGRYLGDLGFPRKRITVVENAIDTSSFALEVSSVDRDLIADVRRKLNFPEDACVAVFCGSLYADKQLEFLIRVGDELYQRHESFRMIVIGDGAERDWMRAAAEARNWLQYHGAQFGLEKAKLFAASDFFLNPGLVGLAILDSFAAGLPFITSDYEGHSPEVAYLVHEGNGLMLPFNFDEFVNGVSRVIKDRDFLASLRAGAQASSKRYTVENMVSNVAGGVVACLSDS